LGRGQSRLKTVKVIGPFIIDNPLPIESYAYARIGQIYEPVHIQALIPEPSVEAFHVAVLHRLVSIRDTIVRNGLHKRLKIRGNGSTGISFARTCTATRHFGYRSHQEAGSERS
jgi:hypothetical protein